MGFFLLYEGMLDSVLVARDRFLKPNGIMFPDKARIKIAAIDDCFYKHRKFNFWTDNEYGIKMKCV